MEMILPQNCHDEQKELLASLIKMRADVYQLITDQLAGGECGYLHDDLYGYPYDYEEYAKESLDPIVRKLNSLMEKVESTFNEIVNEYGGDNSQATFES